VKALPKFGLHWGFISLYFANATPLGFTLHYVENTKTQCITYAIFKKQQFFLHDHYFFLFFWSITSARSIPLTQSFIKYK